MSSGSASIPVPTAPASQALKPAAARTRLLLEGPIVSTMLRLASANVVVNVVLIAVTATVDAYFVAQVGAGALAGISLVFPLIMLMQQVANSSMGGAIASAVARAIGANRHADASALVVHATIIAIVMAAIFSAVLLLGAPAIYTLMGGDGETLAAAVEYSNPIFAGALAYWLLSTFTSIVRGAGQATVLAIVYVAAEVLHIALVPLLMFGFGPVPPLGVTGAGLATVVSFVASTAFLAWYIAAGRTAIKLSLSGVTLSRRLFVEILRVGGPMSFQPILNNIALAALTGFVAALGAAELAGFGIAVRLEYLLYPLAFGLGAAVISMVGTNIGAGQRERAAKITWIGAGLACAITGVIGLFGVTVPGAWTALFSASPEIHTLAAGFLLITGLAFPFLGLGLTLGSACQAVGQPLWPLIGVAGRALVVIAGGWAVTHMFNGGLTGLALVAAAGLVTYGTSLVIASCVRVWAQQPASTP